MTLPPSYAMIPSPSAPPSGSTASATPPPLLPASPLSYAALSSGFSPTKRPTLTRPVRTFPSPRSLATPSILFSPFAMLSSTAASAGVPALISFSVRPVTPLIQLPYPSASSVPSLPLRSQRLSRTVLSRKSFS